MSWLGKKFPAPVAKPMTPFFVAGIVILYGVNSFATLMMNSDEFKNDPRNPNAKSPKPADKH
ncbi:mitochondrial F1F0 ATP synthase-like protein subunit Atp18 [Hyaloscypha variabilis]|uniref:Mitochondrial F1F0 ATP synthase-like protein subunit Atp18 n=1 Tax=Hyaloscypha variabilis (strain UAMH 11265 / GT02V1 / F) TaxID=1149755 RepID=A0A2J6R1Q4_HYAVF|nr:mitochondrial F1F0 ATP synthase-like protein subunit Atp18 [Hyaloscypha variabilis F]